MLQAIGVGFSSTFFNFNLFLKEFAVKHRQFRRIVPNILHWLNQEEEFVDEAQILAWHGALSADSPLLKMQKLTKFIQWLEEADEEEDD